MKKTSNALKKIATIIGTTCTTAVFAHEGHGLAGAAHWHASDAWGFVVLGMVALAIWLTRGGK